MTKKIEDEVRDLTESGRLRQALENGYIPASVITYIKEAIGMRLNSEKPVKAREIAGVGELRKRIGKLDDRKARVALYHMVERIFEGKVPIEILDEAITMGEGYHP